MEKWLLSLDGGKKSVVSVRQKGQQMRTLFDNANVKTKQQLLTADAFWPIIQKNVDSGIWRADTGRFYLQTLKDYYDSCLLNEELCLNEKEKNGIQLILSRIPRWKSAFKTLSNVQKLDKHEQELEKLHNKDVIAKVLSSDSYNDVSDMMKVLNTSPVKTVPLSTGQYILILSYILTLITIRCPKRSGVLGKITLQQYNDRVPFDGQINIKVKQHKTEATYGASILPLSPVLEEWVKVYFEKLRPTIKTTSNKLFINSAGSDIESKDLNKYLNRVWKKTGLPHTYTNLFRKSLVTTVYNEAPSCKDSIATLMDHHTLTAEKHYRLQCKESSAAEGAQVAESMLFDELSINALNFNLKKITSLPSNKLILSEDECNDSESVDTEDFSTIDDESSLTNEVSQPKESLSFDTDSDDDIIPNSPAKSKLEEQTYSLQSTTATQLPNKGNNATVPDTFSAENEQLSLFKRKCSGRPSAFTPEEIAILSKYVKKLISISSRSVKRIGELREIVEKHSLSTVLVKMRNLNRDMFQKKSN